MVTNIPRRLYYGKANDEYSDFLKSEYNHIASAHFSAVSAISTFFKHYLFFVGLPVPIGLAFLKLSDMKKLPFSLEVIQLSIGLIGIILAFSWFLCAVLFVKFAI